MRDLWVLCCVDLYPGKDAVQSAALEASTLTWLLKYGVQVITRQFHQVNDTSAFLGIM